MKTLTIFLMSVLLVLIGVLIGSKNQIVINQYYRQRPLLLHTDTRDGFSVKFKMDFMKEEESIIYIPMTKKDIMVGGKGEGDIPEYYIDSVYVWEESNYSHPIRN